MPRTWPSAIHPPPLAEWIINLGEAAEYMFDHCLYQDNLVGVDFCEQMVRADQPGGLGAGRKNGRRRTPACTAIARSPTSCGRSTRSRERSISNRLQMSRLTREMFCLMEGRHVHPSTLYPGGVGTVPSVQLFNDYLVRLLKYVEFMKRVVPLHDDLFDFFYEALARLRGSRPSGACCSAAGARSTIPTSAITATRPCPTGAGRCTSRRASSSMAS